MTKLICRKRKRSIFMFIILFLVNLLSSMVGVKAENMKEAEKNVLLIYSYNGDEKWGKDIGTCITNLALKGYKVHPKNLDDHGYEDNLYMKSTAEQYMQFFKNMKLDGIITIGEPAMEFIQRYGSEFFGDMPVINTGVNYNEVEVGEVNENQYIVSIDIKMNELIEEIFEIHSDLDTLVVVVDENPSYDWNLEKYIEMSNVDKKKIKCISGDSPEKVINEIDELEGNIVVLYTPISTFSNNSKEEYKIFPKIVESNREVPIYSFWMIVNSSNVVGGLYYNPYEEGQAAGNILKDLWDGEQIENHIIKTEGNAKWQFNYDFVKKYNIQSDKMNENNLKGVPKKKNPIIWIIITIASIIIFVLMNFLYFNITKRRAAEESYEKNKEELTQVKETSKVKTDFFANITHDIRTPIGVIQSITQLLKVLDHNKSDTELKIDSYYKTINDNCNRLLRMTSNLIDMTKIEAGFMELEKKNFEMVGLVENLVLSISELCNKKEIDIVFDTEVEEVVMNCDGYKIERVVMNLLSNAVKFTPPNGEIEVFMSRSDSQLTISVKDSGIGMPENKLNSIFDKFDMGDGNQEINSFGCGIGLYIVKSIVNKHNGGIEVMSKVNEGTEFLIKIPIVENQEEEIVYTYLSDSYNSKINIEFSEISG